MDRIVAVVPMRNESERVPGKNYRELGGRPLYHHIVETLLACRRIGHVVIDTDSDRIRADARDVFPAVEVIDRPPHLRDGKISMNDVLMHDVTRITADLYVQTHATNPLLRPGTVAKAVDALVDGTESDSLFGVTRLQTRLWSAEGKPMNHDRRVLVRTQDLSPVFEENSCLYLFTRESLEQHRNRIGERPILFEIPREEAWDIDEEVDFEIAQSLYAMRADA